jgi:ABC-type phosphate transport system substrate-binding protein
VKRSAVAALAVAVALAVPVALATATSGAAAAAPRSAGYATIGGSGSSWQTVAIEQWSAEVGVDGLTVNYNGDGSAAGRGDYLQGSQVDFASSDVAFRNGHDKLGGTGAEEPQYGYSYIPAVAGGIAFIYHLSVHGHLIHNLRLSARTLMEIFTGQITNWDNPQITRDNGRRLPDLRIVPVVRDDGSGASFFFSDWLSREFPRQWNAFCARVTKGRVKAPCGPTEFYPASGPGWHAEGETGSAATVDYVTSAQGNGAVGYDEYPYALFGKAPVAEISNADGRYVRPTAANVTEALTRAVVDENPHSASYLQEDLAGVFANKNPNSYPLSYYGYLIVPRAGTKVPPIFNRAAGRSLSAFVIFGLCKGQTQVAALGYAPLPRNLVAAGLRQVVQIPGHVAVPSLAKCSRSQAVL